MLKTIVPRIYVIQNLSHVSDPMDRSMLLAIRYGYIKIVRFVLQQLITQIPESFFEEAGAYGQLEIIKTLQEYTLEIPLKAFRKAFVGGFVDVCRYIIQLHKDYVPTPKDLQDAALCGHYRVFKLLPFTVSIPNKCFSAACKSKQYKLIHILNHRRPDYKFSKENFMQALLSGSIETTVAVYSCLSSVEIRPMLPDNTDIILAKKGMRLLMRYLFDRGHLIYTEKALIEAAKRCDVVMMKDILEFLVPSSECVEESLSKIYISFDSLEKRNQACDLLKPFVTNK